MRTFKFGKEEISIRVTKTTTVEIKNNNQIYVYDLDIHNKNKKYIRYKITGFTDNQKNTHYCTPNSSIKAIKSLIYYSIEYKQMENKLGNKGFDIFIIIGLNGELLDYGIDF